MTDAAPSLVGADGHTSSAPPRAPDPADAPTRAPLPRARARLGVLGLALVVWMLPWLSDGTAGPALTGAPALLGLLATWGLAATTGLARTRRGLLVGEAVTSAGVATALTALVLAPHPWLPGPDRSATCVPIFGPLAALALLDAASRLRRPSLGGEVAAIRGLAALLCAGALFVAWDPLLAAAALWLGLAPALVARPASARASRRGAEVAALLASGVVFAAADLHRLVAPAKTAEAGNAWGLVFTLLAAALVILCGRGVLLPEPRD